MAELSYVKELREEKLKVDNSAKKVLALIEREIQKIESGAADSEEIYKFIDATKEKPIKLKERVLIPIKEFPKFNFVGKILGPRGNNLKRIQEETGARISVLGKGSVRSKEEEDRLLGTGDPKYGHLRQDLHVSIEVYAPPLDAYGRMVLALSDFDDDTQETPYDNVVMPQGNQYRPLPMPQNKRMKTNLGPALPPKPFMNTGLNNNFNYSGDNDFGFNEGFGNNNLSQYDNGNSYMSPALRNQSFGRMMPNDFNPMSNNGNPQFNTPPRGKWQNKGPNNMNSGGGPRMSGGRRGGYQRNRY